ncbi:MAG TPA: NAD(P)-dependent oxidoreductase [Candidatus Paceibacterota bacterium]
MKILISGATGFIGTHLIKRLLEEDNSLYAIVRPSTDINVLSKKVTPYVFDNDIDSLISFMRTEKFDGIIHLASVFLAQHKPEEVRKLVDSNVVFGTLLLEASVKSDVPWFVNTGTFWQHYQDKEYSPVNLYSATKQAFEDISKYYIEISPINFVTIKLYDTFGPLDTRPKIFNLWTKISKTNEALDMSGGEQIINMNYIGNVIDGYVRMITLLKDDSEKKMCGRSFTVRSDEILTLKQLATLFERVINTKLNINWGKKDYRPREVMVPWTLGENIPGWKPLVSIEEGIRKTFDL